MTRRPRDAIPPATGFIGSTIKPPHLPEPGGTGGSLTLEQHHAAAREMWVICGAAHRLWLIAAMGPFRPEGPALAPVRRIRNRLQRMFLADFQGQHDPYKDIEC